MKNNNGNKGITLIALVITIIILLILAGVTLNILLGDDGLIEKTKWSAFTTDLARIQESVMVTQKIEDDGSVHIDEEKAFDGQYDNANISDGLKKAIVLEKQGDLDAEITKEEVDSKYEELKDKDGKIKDLYYIKESIAKKDKEYLYDIKTNTVLKISSTRIFNKDYHAYNVGYITSTSSININKPNGPDLSEHKGLEPNWIPIYTVEQYKKIATEEQNYDIYNTKGTKVGTYNMDKNVNYRLMNDLDFTAVEADSIKGFKGTFDGNGYYIKNITIDKSASTDEYYYYSTDNLMNKDVSETKVGVPAGLFDRIECGKVENLGIDNASITGVANAGIISGEIIQTTIQNCLIKNSSVVSNGETKSGATGGLVGWSYKKDEPSILNTIKMDNVNVKGASVTSGLIAVSTSDISIAACSVENSTIDMQATNMQYNYEAQAGIIGYTSSNTVIDNCYVGKTTFKNNLTQSKPSNTCGGILGATHYSGNTTITISKSSIEDSELAYSANSGGIVGCLMYGTNTLNITECNSQNLKINSFTTGGILGFAYGNDASTLNIKNCKVNKLETEENLMFTDGNTINIGGITGFIFYIPNGSIEDSNVTNSTITLYKSKKDGCTSIAGILGGNGSSQSNFNETIKNCNVENTTLKLKLNSNSSTYYSSNINISGIAGGSDYDIDTCNINDSKIILEAESEFTGKYDSSGEIIGANACGILGTNCGGLYRNNKIVNCKINNTEILNNYGKSMGIIDFNYKVLEISNCTIENSTISGKVSTAGVTEYSSGKLTIDSVNIKNTNIISDVRHASGIITCGYPSTTISNCNVDNCEIKNLKTENSNGMNTYMPSSKGNIAGIVGYANGCVVNNCNVTNTNLTNHYDNTGGIVGFTYSDITSCNVKNITIIADKENTGGIVGLSMGNPITDCSVKETIIESKGINVGGITGADVSSSKIKECSLKDVTITTENSFVGGIAGILFPNDISNCTLENVNINTNGKYVGGVAGWAYIAGSGITNCDITSSKINAENYAVGGLIGSCDNSSTISGCDITSTEINGKDNGVGGMVGIYKGYTNSSSSKTADILNCNLTNSKVTITGADAKAVGGIIGNGCNDKNSTSTIDSCNISGTQISGVDYVGGISGAASTNIKNCTIDNQSTITGRNCVGGIQGFGGIHGKFSINYDMWGSSSKAWSTITNEREFSVVTNISGCQVNNSTISGTSDVNYIQGKNSYFVEGWTGDTPEDTISDSTYNSVTLNTNV